MIVPRTCATCGEPVGLAVLCRGCGHDPDEGRVLDGKFRVDLRLGRGGMSRVYRGVHVALDEAVAIKFLRPELALDAVIRERFRREAVALARLRHPSIVSILDYGETEGQPYVVMELLAGLELDELAGIGQKLPLLRAAPIFDQILAALEACHEVGVVHRDVKPANILVTRRGESDYATLIDFGLARTTALGDEKLTSTGLIHGTPTYMAPEQCRGEEVFPPADVYALGVTLYEVLTGMAPFQAADAATLMAQHLFIEPRPVRTLAPELPSGIEELVQAALAKDPARRPTSRALRHELAAVVRGTDRHALAASAATARQREGGLPREERAITGRPPSEVAAAKPAEGAAHLWLPVDDRRTALLAALGAAGLAATVTDAGEPPADLDRGAVLVVSAQAGGADRVARRDGRPVLVLDVTDVAETTRLVRAGADDVALGGTAEAEIVSRIQRLARRAARAGQHPRGGQR